MTHLCAPLCLTPLRHSRRYAFVDYEKPDDSKADDGEVSPDLQKQYELFTVRPYRPVSLTLTAEYPFDVDRYASDAAVLGRWTPRAVEAFRGLLREPSVQRERKNAAVLAR